MLVVFRGLVEREVSGIRGLLPDVWQWATEWPLQISRTYDQIV